MKIITDKTIEVIKPIARKARKWIIKTIKKDCPIRKKVHTEGYCAIATAKLYELLREEPKLKDCKIVPTVIDNNLEGSHAFMIVNDFIVDVTADQFRTKKIKTKAIEIRTVESAKRNWFWNTKINKRKVGDIDKTVWQGIEEFAYTTEGWDDQSPQRYGLLREEN